MFGAHEQSVPELEAAGGPYSEHNLLCSLGGISCFQGTHYEFDEDGDEDWSSSGDVKYHLGTSMDRTYPDGRRRV